MVTPEGFKAAYAAFAEGGWGAIAAPEALGYRWSAKRIAFGGPGKLRLGSFMRGTNRPADMEGCLVDHPLIAAAADELAEAARDLGIAAAW